MKKIIFVDDEQNILNGLKRTMYVQRKVWDMKFVTSGALALEEMGKDSFDVIVTDMRMPGMDGAQLLKRVQERHPRTVRIVLSGFADMEAAMRSVSVSHQFLAKPCDADELKRVVKRACNLDQLLYNEKLQEIVGHISDLPVLPRVYQALAEALRDTDVDVQTISSLVEQDVAITSKILQLVNSSFFGLRKEVTDLRQATCYLGLNTIRDLVLSFELFSEFTQPQDMPHFCLSCRQSHSFLTARIARGMGRDKTQSEQAFLAAMLHDIGILISVTCLADQMRQVLTLRHERSCPLHEVETEIFGVSHAEIGAYLLGLWGMPYPIIEAVAFHHKTETTDFTGDLDIATIVCIADQLAHEIDARHCGAALCNAREFLDGLEIPERMEPWRQMAEEEFLSVNEPFTVLTDCDHQRGLS